MHYLEKGKVVQIQTERQSKHKQQTRGGAPGCKEELWQLRDGDERYLEHTQITKSID